MRSEEIAEEHAEFIKRWYKDVFLHGYKHGKEDAFNDKSEEKVKS